MEEGCLSLPAVLVDVERPIHVRVRALDEHGEPILIEASGLEARVIQHEIDHLDGVLILDRTSRDQRKEAMRALREADAAPSLTDPRVRTVYLGTSRVRRRRARAPAPIATSPPAGRHAPRPPAGPRTPLAPPPVARRRPRARDRARPARSRSTTPTLAPAIAEAAPDVAGRVRVRRADQGTAAVGAPHPQRPSLAAAAVARRGADRAGDHGGGRSAPACRSWSSRPASTAGRCALEAQRADRPDDTYGTLAAGWQRIGGELLVRALDESPPCAEQDETRVTYADKITAARPRARSRAGPRLSSSGPSVR